MSRTGKVVLVTFSAFTVYFILHTLLLGKTYRLLNSILAEDVLSYLLAYLIVGIPLFIGILLLHKPQHFFSSLGFHRKIGEAFLFAMICTLPMLIGFALNFSFNSGITFRYILMGAVAAAFFEELYFRGFFFGQIFRYTRFGFLPAILLPSVIFASLHLYQSFDVWIMTGIFITTLLGSALFAWVFAEWDNNLWVPVFLHFLMNLVWMLFSAGGNALGGLISNLTRALTVALIIILTLYKKRMRREALVIRNGTILLKREIIPQAEPEV